MLALIVGVAAIAGILIGFWLRGASVRAEKAQLAVELSAARSDLARLQMESTARARFEALAAEREKMVDTLRQDLHTKSVAESAQAARVKELEAELRNERQNLTEKLALLEIAKQTLANQFQTLASEILETKSKSFSEGSQKELGSLLAPLKIQIEDFRKKVEEAQTDSKSGVVKLETLIGTLGNLNQQLTVEAHNLATALRRDTKAQGNWGETILRNILDKSGLQEGLHYSFQESFVEEAELGASGRRRQTDVVVRMPGGRHLIIDSKVSLNAYNDSVNAENENDRADAIKRHLGSVRSHFNELSGRNYQRLPGITSPDFVVMFVPIEPAFLVALQSDEAIWLDAYQKGVLVSGPTTVLLVISIVRDLWRQEQQAENVERVMKRGAELYDKFVGFATNLESVGNALYSARQAFDEATKQLTSGPGSLVRQVEMLRELGVRPKGKKQIPRKFMEQTGIEEVELALPADGEEAADGAF